MPPPHEQRPIVGRLDAAEATVERSREEGHPLGEVGRRLLHESLAGRVGAHRG